MKQSRHDHFLRKFEYSKALDQVLKLYVQKRYPEYTYSVLRELKRWVKFKLFANHLVSHLYD